MAEGVEVTGTGGTYIYKLAEFPSDEAVLKAIRDGNQNITVDGAIVEKKDITTDNFTVRWCVFKHNITDQWHIDGMLVRKQGKLAVTKTFYGDQDAINAVIILRLQLQKKEIPLLFIHWDCMKRQTTMQIIILVTVKR